MKLDFNAFKSKIKTLPKDKFSIYRNKYIDKFVDSQSEYFKKYIKNKKVCSDGLCYEGYLWDCLKKPIKIKMNDIIAYSDRLNSVIVFWDIHSKDKIFIENYWKFGKETIIEIDFNILIDNLEYLPEDIYIIDKNFEWSLILTHEDNNGERICAKVGKI